jgi:hypothetical protein
VEGAEVEGAEVERAEEEKEEGGGGVTLITQRESDSFPSDESFKCTVYMCFTM